jgi:hypothetical protein
MITSQELKRRIRLKVEVDELTLDNIFNVINEVTVNELLQGNPVKIPRVVTLTPLKKERPYFDINSKEMKKSNRTSIRVTVHHSIESKVAT